MTTEVFMELPNWAIGGLHEISVLQELLVEFPKVQEFRRRRWLLFNTMPDSVAIELAQSHNEVNDIRRSAKNILDTVGYMRKRWLANNRTWTPELKRDVLVCLHRNPDIQSQDAYFQFTKWPDYSYALGFRLLSGEYLVSNTRTSPPTFYKTDQNEDTYALDNEESRDPTWKPNSRVMQQISGQFRVDNKKHYRRGKPAALKIIFSFNPLPELIRQKLLSFIVHGHISLRQGHEECLVHVTRMKIRTAFLKLASLQDWLTAQELYPALTTENSLQSWFGVFRSQTTRNEIPHSFIVWVKKGIEGAQLSRIQADAQIRKEIFEFNDYVSATVICCDVSQLANVLTIPRNKGDHSSDICMYCCA